MITSAANEKVKHIAALTQKAKLRQEEGIFLIEGSRIFEEAPVSLIKEVYVSESFLKNQDGKVKEKLQETDFEEVSDRIFQKLSDTKTPQGILAILRQQKYERKDLLKNMPLLLLLEDIQDPGNMGTIFRTAEGAGVTGIIMSRGCVDLYNPKTVRSTMGSIFRMPFYVTKDLIREIRSLRKEGVRVFAAHLDGDRNYEEEDYRTGTAFLVGNEGNGLKKETVKEADIRIRIPMQGKLESLNAAVSAALLSYEAARQRRTAGGRK